MEEISLSIYDFEQALGPFICEHTDFNLLLFFPLVDAHYFCGTLLLAHLPLHVLNWPD